MSVLYTGCCVEWNRMASTEWSGHCPEVLTPQWGGPRHSEHWHSGQGLGTGIAYGWLRPQSSADTRTVTGRVWCWARRERGERDNWHIEALSAWWETAETRPVRQRHSVRCDWWMLRPGRRGARISKVPIICLWHRGTDGGPRVRGSSGSPGGAAATLQSGPKHLHVSKYFNNQP